MDELEEALASIKRDYKSMINSLDNALETTEDMRDALGMPRKSLVPTQKHRPMLGSTTQQPRQLQRKVVTPTYSNKSMMHQQIREIKSASLPRHQMLFDERFDELTDDPEQQEAFVGWYHTRLRKGIIGF